jgi:hypothetical protein
MMIRIDDGRVGRLLTGPLSLNQVRPRRHHAPCKTATLLSVAMKLGR